MNCVGIDVSKGKSMIAVMRPFGEVVLTPFEVQHTAIELSELTKTLKRLVGETRVVMEATGNYHVPIALALQSAGFYVSIVNAILVHDYGNNSLRRAKTTKRMPLNWQTMVWTIGSHCPGMFQKRIPG